MLFSIEGASLYRETFEDYEQRNEWKESNGWKECKNKLELMLRIGWGEKTFIEMGGKKKRVKENQVEVEGIK